MQNNSVGLWWFVLFCGGFLVLFGVFLFWLFGWFFPHKYKASLHKRVQQQQNCCVRSRTVQTLLISIYKINSSFSFVRCFEIFSRTYK